MEQFREHVWVTPFVDDHVGALLEHVPVERVLFGSDWPHAEGFAEPRQYLGRVADLSIDDQRRIMRDNARELTFTSSSGTSSSGTSLSRHVVLRHVVSGTAGVRRVSGRRVTDREGRR